MMGGSTTRRSTLTIRKQINEIFRIVGTTRRRGLGVAAFTTLAVGHVMFLAVGYHIFTLKPGFITIVVHLVRVEEKIAMGQIFRRFLQDCKKRLLASSLLSLSLCPSVCATTCNSSAPIGRIFVKFGINIFRKLVEKTQFP
jgi:hypothetical protein